MSFILWFLISGYLFFNFFSILFLIIIMFPLNILLLIFLLNLNDVATTTDNCFFYETVRISRNGICTRDDVSNRLYCRPSRRTPTDADGWMTLESNHNNNNDNNDDDGEMELTIACEVEGEECTHASIVRRRRTGIKTRPACVSSHSSSFDFFVE